jgi:hypothetical protein
MKTKIYAGIGSRETPGEMLDTMLLAGKELGRMGWYLRTGGANGADTAFAHGAHPQMRQIHLPWNGYNGLFVEQDASRIVPVEQGSDHQAYEIAAAHHPAWHWLSPAVRSLMARNVTIILGANLDAPANMVVCWTAGGRGEGGTGQGIRVAKTYGIEVFDLGLPETLPRFIHFVNSYDSA